MTIYTKTGDDGTTGLQGNTRLSKSHPRIMAYGSVDEANASLGVALATELDNDVRSLLTQIQNELFVVGADLSNPNLDDEKNRVTIKMITDLESNIDKFEEKLPPLTNFILPGGDTTASHIHLTRTIVRRAETLSVLLNEREKINENCIKYLNRLSDLLFVLGRFQNKQKGKDDILWKI